MKTFTQTICITLPFLMAFLLHENWAEEVNLQLEPCEGNLTHFLCYSFKMEMPFFHEVCSLQLCYSVH